MAEPLTRSSRRSLAPWEDLLGDLAAEDGNGWGSWMLGETADFLQVRLDLPDVDANQIDIHVSGSRLTVLGERKEANGATHRLETHTGQFSHVIVLPCAVDDSKIDICYHDGVLNIQFPKAEQSSASRISAKPK